ncbi:hypothetical protein NKR23_g12450 [Pleurostoma richardsiae]|uniref:Uncharacterized protein n=1 Tax=Pleurostoma richardsiae TaxID=41990 RepID=A0AA38VIF5_9PEZI|nr:hypothetical protein NKR23_g12450 [Pleurostoma richardsiae]
MAQLQKVKRTVKTRVGSEIIKTEKEPEPRGKKRAAGGTTDEPTAKKANTGPPSAEQIAKIQQIAYYSELETIRRKKPYLDPKNAVILELQVKERKGTNDIETVDITSNGPDEGAQVGGAGADRGGTVDEPIEIDSPPKAKGKTAADPIEIGSPPRGKTAADPIEIDSSPKPKPKGKGKTAADPIEIDSAPKGKGKGKTAAKPSRIGSAERDVAEDPLSFYGVARNEAYRLQFQDRVADKGQTPSTVPGTRLLATKFQRAAAIQPKTAADMDALFAGRDLYQPHRDVRDLERAIRKVWSVDTARGHPPLIKGLPLVEDVVFLRPANFAGSRSNCFYKAIAYHIYGTNDWWDRVKAEHMFHVFNVLMPGPAESRHARCGEYEALNRKFYSTTVIPQGGDRLDVVANLFQQLHLPQVYTATDMFDITADLYGVFIVVFSVDRNNTITRVYTRGSYNARHLLFLFDERIRHFQPLVPNEFVASEFRYPRITLASTDTQPGLGSSRMRREGIFHKWRGGGSQDFLKKGVPPPVPVDHAWFLHYMQHVYNATSKKF